MEQTLQIVLKSTTFITYAIYIVSILLLTFSVYCVIKTRLKQKETFKNIRQTKKTLHRMGDKFVRNTDKVNHKFRKYNPMPGKTTNDVIDEVFKNE